MSLVFAVIIARAQTNPGGFWGWVLKSPHVVPGLLAIAFVSCVVLIGQWSSARDVYWRIFAWLVPPNGYVRVDDDERLVRAVKAGIRAFATERESEREAEPPATEVQRAETELPSPTSPPASVQQPKDRDLRGKINFILFRKQVGGWGSSTDFDVLLNLTLTNHGKDPVIVNTWSLAIRIGSPEVGSTKNQKIPPSMLWQKLDGSAEPISDDDLMSHVRRYENGVPNTGWLLFSFSGYRSYVLWTPGYDDEGIPVAPYNAEFTVLARDTLGQDHVLVMGPWLYSSRGEIIG